MTLLTTKLYILPPRPNLVPRPYLVQRLDEGLRRAQGQFGKARRDLEEALAIATRSRMRLHEADCYLEYTRLHLARCEQTVARERLDRAREMIAQMGYHRRDGEVAELEERL